MQEVATSTACGTGASAQNTCSWDKQVDILVIGGGIGGTMAGFAAVAGGAKTIVAEAGSELGGTMLLSQGFVHTMGLESADDLATLAPSGHPVLAKRFMDEWVEFRDTWLVGTGAPHIKRVEQPHWNMMCIGKSYETRQEFFSFFVDEITKAGSEVLLHTRGISLCTDSTNTIVGAVLCDAEGNTIRVSAKAVILACGGFGANEEMKKRYFGAFGDRIVPWSVPYNKGDGHRMALEVGAQLSGSMGRFYGHVAPWPNPIPTETQAYDNLVKECGVTTMRSIYELAQSGMLINLGGKRFVDEACTTHMSQGDCYAAEMMATQEQGYGFVIADCSSARHAKAVDELRPFGAVIEQADTLEELADKLAARGVRKVNFLKTVEEFNTVAPEEFEIAQTARESDKAKPLTTPPFFAIQATGGCSATLGGVKIDADARVLGAGDQPIKNLYATACCAGGFSYDEYLGALALSSVYGKVAATTALSELK